MYSTSDAEYCECGAPLKEGLKPLPKAAARAMTGEDEPLCCRLCHIENVPLAPASFRANAGFVIFRVKDNLSGYFCERCIDDAFWKQHTLSAIFGWWGVISLFSNVVHIPLNLVAYFRAMRELSPRRLLPSLGAWMAWAAGLSAVVISYSWWLGRFDDLPWRLGNTTFWWSAFVLVPFGVAFIGRAFFRAQSPSNV